MRRAEENTSVKGQTDRELALLQDERKRRKGEITKANREKVFFRKKKASGEKSTFGIKSPTPKK
jgi:hypothetical protein